MNFQYVDITPDQSAYAPTKATNHAAGYDVRARFWNDAVTTFTRENEKVIENVADSIDTKLVVIHPGRRMLVPTGIALKVPHGHVALVYPRSGLSVKHSINLINNVGVIDSDYSGELMLPLYNASGVPFVIWNGDRLAQVILHQLTPETNDSIFLEKTTMEDLIDHVKNSNRNEGLAGGFGSTGQK